MKALTSRKGFTLIELLVVIGILAVLAAIAIPSVAGLIDRANVSADNSNTNEMTNAIERFVSEYELYCQDIQAGTLDTNNLSASQSRVYNVVQTTDWDEIKLIENGGNKTIVIDRNTKYPLNKSTAKRIIENYTKTSSSTFDPKQSDKHFYFSPDVGTVVVDDAFANYKTLNEQIIGGTDGKGNSTSHYTEWFDLTNDEKMVYCICDAYGFGTNETCFTFFFPEAQYDRSTETLTFQTEDGPKILKQFIILRTNDIRIESLGETLNLDSIPNERKLYYIPNNSNIVSMPKNENIYGRDTGFAFKHNFRTVNSPLDTIQYKKVVLETIDGEFYYTQTFCTSFETLPKR